MQALNISGYHFFENQLSLDTLSELKIKLRDYARSINVKGTVLLAPEGVNIFVAGAKENIEQFTNSLPIFGLPKIVFKESYSDAIPFRRMIVKLKEEIIKMGVPEVDPAKNPAPYIKSEELKQWYEQDKDFIILDTRNDYEMQAGKFKNAIDPKIRNFHEFPEAIKNLPEEYKDKPVVTYCTGGIRCEKAAPFLIQNGFKQVYQLEGGIIKYFEEVGGEHYEGDCFVFDQRISLDPKLNQTETIQCHACRSPLTLSEQQSEDFIQGQHCPHCV